MNLPEGFWLLTAIVIVGSALLFYLRWRRSGVEPEVGMADTGSAIESFSRAFPDLPIRNVVMTRDGSSAFLRLADSRVGFVEHAALHSAARLLEPQTLTVGAPPDSQTINIAFPGAAGGGLFEFSSVEEAAEVSLWLCGEFAVVGADSPALAEKSDGE
ncbi:hypothetical protein [Hoeflea poritis]|uniref:Uncharacterized protein n=1 Tax=Hoeflea poritis TaxID=2993659 RepID=A0ABT4VPV5_9HYPH|nr:hypothetical protein [Hoeflea poritis]MDA4846654.1 hypothetical protein [Hoeflea poritis]